MIAGVISLIIIFILYQLLVKGYLFKIPLFFGGWIGIYALLRVYVPASTSTLITVSEVEFSTAAVIPTVICFLALLTTKD